MKKILATALIAGSLVTTAAVAEDIRPLETSASTQLGGDSGPSDLVVVGVALALLIAVAGSGDGDGAANGTP